MNMTMKMNLSINININKNTIVSDIGTGSCLDPELPGTGPQREGVRGSARPTP
jgi:hypothetical protein